MELDELKQKWTELSEQVEKNELLNRQIIIDMIQSKNCLLYTSDAADE